MLPDLALSSTLTSSNYPCLELMFMVPKVFKPLKFSCISHPGLSACLNYSLLEVLYKNVQSHGDTQEEYHYFLSRPDFDQLPLKSVYKLDYIEFWLICLPLEEIMIK